MASDFKAIEIRALETAAAAYEELAAPLRARMARHDHKLVWRWAGQGYAQGLYALTPNGFVPLCDWLNWEARQPYTQPKKL